MKTKKEKDYEDLIRYVIDQIQWGLKVQQVDSVALEVLKVLNEKMTTINTEEHEGNLSVTNFT